MAVRYGEEEESDVERVGGAKWDNHVTASEGVGGDTDTLLWRPCDMALADCGR